MEHGIRPDGVLWSKEEDRNVDYDNFFLPMRPFYAKLRAGEDGMKLSLDEEVHYIPRCIMVDTEPTVTGELF